MLEAEILKERLDQPKKPIGRHNAVMAEMPIAVQWPRPVCRHALSGKGTKLPNHHRDLSCSISEE